MNLQTENLKLEMRIYSKRLMNQFNFCCSCHRERHNNKNTAKKVENCHDLAASSESEGNETFFWQSLRNNKSRNLFEKRRDFVKKKRHFS